MPDRAIYISSSELEVYMDVRRRDEARSPLLEKYQQNPVYEFIRSISTPMFLGLDRRFYAPGSMSDDEQRRREYLVRRFWPEEPGSRPGAGISAAISVLAEVNYLVVNRTQEIRAAQARLDDSLRAKFLTKAFEYKPGGIGTPNTLPSRADIETYRKQLEKIEKAAGVIDIPVPEIQSALKHFFERLTGVVDDMNKDVQIPSPSKKSGRKKAKQPSNATRMSSSFIEWIINKPQADRIVEHLRMLEEYVADRNSLHHPVERFLKLVNGFFQQTRKNVSVTNTGQLNVNV